MEKKMANSVLINLTAYSLAHHSRLDLTIVFLNKLFVEMKTERLIEKRTYTHIIY